MREHHLVSFFFTIHACVCLLLLRMSSASVYVFLLHPEHLRVSDLLTSNLPFISLCLNLCANLDCPYLLHPLSRQTTLLSSQSSLSPTPCSSPLPLVSVLSALHHELVQKLSLSLSELESSLEPEETCSPFLNLPPPLILRCGCRSKKPNLSPV